MPNIPYIAVPFAIINHSAYIELTKEAQRMLLLFRGKVKLPLNHKDYHKVEFEFPYRGLVSHKFDSKNISKLISELEAVGFIAKTAQGGIVAGREVASKYKLSSKWQK